MTGFRGTDRLNEALRQINSIEFNINDSRNDGFTTFEMKKDLYRLKFHLDAVLKRSPKFYGEEDWLEKEAERQVWIMLGGNEYDEQ